MPFSVFIPCKYLSADFVISNAKFFHFSRKATANQIIVLEKGQIVEKGTHDKLLENKGWYYKNLMKTDGKFV